MYTHAIPVVTIFFTKLFAFLSVGFEQYKDLMKYVWQNTSADLSKVPASPFVPSYLNLPNLNFGPCGPKISGTGSGSLPLPGAGFAGGGAAFFASAFGSFALASSIN